MHKDQVFQEFDAYCRRGDLGSGTTTPMRTALFNARVGNWIFVTECFFTENGLQETIEVVLEHAQRLKKPAMWRVFNGKAASELCAALAQAGFTPASKETLLSFDLSQEVGAPEFKATAVRDEDQLDQYIEIVAAAFQEPFSISPERRRALLSSDKVVTLISNDADGPMSAGQMDMQRDVPVVLLRGGSTVPAKQRRGGYRSLVRSRLRLAQSLGKQRAFVEARPSSCPVLLDMGFTQIVAGETWTFKPV